LRVEDFRYELPPERIAQEPCRPREVARLLVHEASGSRTSHRRVGELPDLLEPGDLLVLNDTRVLPARLRGRRAMVQPARKLRAGERVEIAPGELELRALERPQDPAGRPGPEWIVELLGGAAGESVEALLERFGELPLPPYIERGAGDPRGARDREDYQTVYARHPGAVAAPTAGLHLGPDLLARLEERGVEKAFVTLHVGIGTFRPVEVEDTQDHVMHSERFALGSETVAAVERTRAGGGRVVAVGTTSVRVLESCVGEDGRLRPGAGETSLFLTPGHRFQVVDALFTNFLLPVSTLLILVCAFGGRERVLDLYREAIREGYRFYSYGDAMLLFGAEQRARPPIMGSGRAGDRGLTAS
jgi:S-adenosylmethionine:tRNA ribosyltransferase-isomerase